MLYWDQVMDVLGRRVLPFCPAIEWAIPDPLNITDTTIFKHLGLLSVSMHNIFTCAGVLSYNVCNYCGCNCKGIL